MNAFAPDQDRPSGAGSTPRGGVPPDSGAPEPRERRRAALVVPPEEVHLWQARTDFPDAGVARLAAQLSAAERERAARYRFPADRRRFIVARGLLRTLLGAYLGSAPREVRLNTGVHGKPYVDLADAGWPLHFNGSHSGDWFVAAIARQPVGVDIELVPARGVSQQIPDLILSPDERSAFAVVPEALRHELLYTLWTRKEAVLKALGVGLREPMRSVSVSVGREAPPRVTGFANGRDDPAEWLLHDVAPAPGVVGALALRARVARVRSWKLLAESPEVWPSPGGAG